MRGEVEKAAAIDTPRLAQTLANAFYDDPAIGWMVPDDERRRRVGPMGFRAWLEKIYLPKGSVYTDPDRKAAALWAPPGKWRMSVGVQLRLTPAMIRIVGFKRPPLIVKGPSPWSWRVVARVVAPLAHGQSKV